VGAYKHISVDIRKTKEYMTARKDGLLPSAETPYRGLNDALLDGIPWWTLMTIVGTPSSGKSTIMEQIKYFIMEQDPLVECLSFEFDMIVRMQILRHLSKKTGIGLKSLQSARGYVMTEEEAALVEEAIKTLGDKPVFNIDKAQSVAQIKTEICQFVIDRELDELWDNEGNLTDEGRKKKLIVTIDYITLTKGKNDEDAKRIVDNLYQQLVDMKKDFEDMGLSIIFLCLSQTNRDIFSSARVSNKALHYPTEADIFGSSAIFSNSDIVLFSMNPSRVRGIKEYGDLNYPVYDLRTGLPMIYFHLLKNRFGECPVLHMIADFKNSTIRDAYQPTNTLI
jgi:RecA/RadA recombinase